MRNAQTDDIGNIMTRAWKHELTTNPGADVRVWARQYLKLAGCPIIQDEQYIARCSLTTNKTCVCTSFHVLITGYIMNLYHWENRPNEWFCKN